METIIRNESIYYSPELDKIIVVYTVKSTKDEYWFCVQFDFNDVYYNSTYDEVFMKIVKKTLTRYVEIDEIEGGHSSRGTGRYKAYDYEIYAVGKKEFRTLYEAKRYIKDRKNQANAKKSVKKISLLQELKDNPSRVLRKYGITENDIERLIRSKNKK